MILLRYIFVALILCLAVVGQDPSWSIKTPNFWSQKRRDVGFQRMHLIYPTHIVSASRAVHTLGDGPRLPLSIDAAKYMGSQRASGLIIIHEGQIRFERYALGLTRSGRWASFSVAKSIVSTLVGAAIKDGYIRSLEDMVSSYIPELKGSVYDGVSIHQLLTMTSGVKWNENYLDPQSDAVRLRLHRPEHGIDATVSYMRNLPRDRLPGTRWLYNTGETNLVGALIRQATRKSLSAYLAEKIWIPYGMEQDDLWELDESNVEMGGCCLSASLRDYARFGQFILDGAKIAGTSIVPSDWVSHATSKQIDTGIAGKGYGYQWWTNDDGSFQASGIFGQSIFVDPLRHLVIATNADWPTATDAKLSQARMDFIKTVQAAVDSSKGTRVGASDGGANHGILEGNL